MVLTVFCMFNPKSCFSDIPHLINYQGKLADSSGTPVTGTKDIIFRIYDAASGGTPLWEETQSVTADRGLFNVLLGSSTTLNLPFDVPYYLGIQVAGDTEMSPRAKIGAAGYAFRAEDANQAQNADTVDGIHASSSPESTKLIALDDNAKFPPQVLDISIAQIRQITYTGNGVDDRNITGVGFTPNLVILFCTDPGNNAIGFKTASMAGRDLTVNDAGMSFTDWIQDFIPDGFQIGSSININRPGTHYEAICIRTAAGSTQ